MSLIIDALKKAQQLRLKEFKGAPFLKYPRPEKKSLTNLRRWILISAGLFCFLILLFFIWRPTFLPLTIQSNQTIALTEKKPSISKAEKISKEPLRLPKDKEPTPTQTLPPQGGGKVEGEMEQVLPKKEPSIEERGKEPLVKQMAEERKVKKAVQPKKSSIEKVSSPTPPAYLKEEALSNSIGVEQKVEKDRPLASDILNQFNLGVYFYNQREISKAIHAYKKVIEMDPAYIEAYNNLGIIYQELGDFENALKVYQKSIEINSQYEKAYNNLGILFYLKDRYEEALEAFQKALAINPNNIESYINCGILFKKRGEWDKAIESYRKALAINPLHGETHYNIALLYEQMENVELAIGHYQTFIQLSSRTHPELVSKVERHLNNLMKERKGK